jgi:hypothetical protein
MERDSANDRPSADGGGDPPPYAYLRHDEPVELAWFEGDERSRGDRPHHLGRLVLDSEDRAETVAYADIDGAEAVQEFVAATDFETETVFVDQRTIEECYRLELCAVGWSATDVDLAYSRVGLAHDVPCEANAEAIEARFVRIPDTLDHESLSSFSSSIDRGGCPERHEPVAGSDLPGHADDADDADEAGNAGGAGDAGNAGDAGDTGDAESGETDTSASDGRVRPRFWTEVESR